MAVVNFYKFASAIMELLNSNNEDQLNSTILPSATPPISQLNIVAASKNLAATQTLSAALSNKTVASTDTLNSAENEVNVETVKVVATRLSQALESASQEKINTIAQALATVATQTQTEQMTSPSQEKISLQKQVLVETLAAVNESIGATSDLTVQPSNLITGNSNTQIAVTLVQAAVETIAKQTVKEVENNLDLKSVKNANLDGASIAEIKISSEEVKATVEKVIQKQELPVSSVNTDVGNVKDNFNQSLRVEASMQPLSSLVNDFWENYQEADPSDIKYEGLMRYAYGYMVRNSLLDSLNPEIQVSQRRDTMFKAFDSASSEIILENNRFNDFEREAENLLNSLKENDDNSSIMLKRDQLELKYRQLAERQRLEQKLAELNSEQSEN